MFDTTDLIALGVILVMTLGLYLVRRRLTLSVWNRSPISSELQAALNLHDQDATAGEQAMDAYFGKQAEREEVERSHLWQQAPTDLNAAKELRRRLAEDLKLNALARKEFADTSRAKPELERQIDEGEQRVRAQLAQLDLMIKTLPGH